MPKIYAVPFQRQVILSVARFMCLMAGRRAGKTDAIKGRIKYLVTKYVKFRYMYVTPLSGQALEIYSELMADKIFYQYVRKYKERPYPRIFLKNGSRIWFRNFQRPRGLRSTGEDEICLDESQDEVYLEEHVNQIVMPMISDRVSRVDGNRGRLLISGQFRGEDWRYEKYWLPGMVDIDGAANPLYDRRFQSWQVPSWDGYVFQLPGGKDELDLQKRLCTPGTWEQEWACIPRANANAFFSSDDIDRICAKRYAPVPFEQLDKTPLRAKYCTGVDIGRRVDPTKIAVVNDQGNVAYCEERPLGERTRSSAHRAALIAKHFNNSPLLGDVTGQAGHAVRTSEKESAAKVYRDEAEKAGLEFHDFFWQMHNKRRIMDQLSIAFQEGEIGIPYCNETRVMVKELKAYEFKYNDNTKIYILGAPKGQHDDYVSALAMSYEGYKRGWISGASRSISGALQ